MRDIILDTNYLADIMIQYFNGSKINKIFNPSDLLDYNAASEINRVINYGVGSYIIGASSFAFVEIARKFDIINDEKISVDQFMSFINQPPEWFLIADLDHNLFKILLDIPGVAVVGDDLKNVEWADALHLATALIRENCYLFTSDSTIRALEIFKSRVKYNK